MRRLLTRIISVVLLGSAILLFVSSLALFGFWFYTNRGMKPNFKAEAKSLLVVAPHPDDGVIMAAGYAMQVKRHGGEVKIAYLTGTRQRFAEARVAWACAGIYGEDLIRINLDEANLDELKLPVYIARMREIIARHRPQVIIVPLYEGGHHDHDLANYIVGAAAAPLGSKVEILEAPEYNDYFSLRYTPEKVMDVISRMLPFFEYNAPPTFIDGRKRLYLLMTDDDLQRKRHMLEKFRSRGPQTLLSHFGHGDRFQVYAGHNYYEPPHDNGNKVLYFLRDSRRFSRVSALFQKPYWKSGTLYSKHDRRPLGPLFSNSEDDPRVVTSHLLQ